MDPLQPLQNDSKKELIAMINAVLKTKTYNIQKCWKKTIPSLGIELPLTTQEG